MSAPSFQTAPVAPPGDERSDGARPRPRRRRRLMAAAIVIAMLLAAGIALVLTDPWGSPSRANNGVGDNTAPTGLATITRRTLSSQDQVNGTLGYGGSYTILNMASGVFTRLPSAGQVIEPGKPLYWVDGKPVLLLSGNTPAYRALSEGMSGLDVKELNSDLVTLGYATAADIGAGSDYFSAATATALEKLQNALGVTETGELGLGDAVFEPGALRIKSVTASLGGPAGSGAPVAQASGAGRQVQVALDATQQADVAVGDHVEITLPDDSVTPGVVSGVGKVATSGSNGSTVDVYVRPLRPRDTGSLDQAPVQVAITTGTVHHALVVPVNALLALASGGYAVEEVDARGVHRLIPATVGLFDDADGLVQIEGAALTAGQRVVVPAGS
jgi:Putative peptidoglycan binding domain